MPSPNDMHVTVHLHLDQDPKFHLTLSGKRMGENEPIVFQNRGRPGFNIHYTLDDPTGQYRWPHQSDIRDAVWSEMGETGCPNDPIWDVLEPRNVSGPNRERLTVYNPNSGDVVGKFRYTLRVVTSSGKWQNLDPGGDNQNGPINRFESALLFYVAAGGALGVAVSYFQNNELVASSALVYGGIGVVAGAVLGMLLSKG